MLHYHLTTEQSKCPSAGARLTGANDSLFFASPFSQLCLAPIRKVPPVRVHYHHDHRVLASKGCDHSGESSWKRHPAKATYELPHLHSIPSTSQHFFLRGTSNISHFKRRWGKKRSILTSFACTLDPIKSQDPPIKPTLGNQVVGALKLRTKNINELTVNWENYLVFPKMGCL